jgi:hypothetical protein
VNPLNAYRDLISERFTAARGRPGPNHASEPVADPRSGPAIALGEAPVFGCPIHEVPLIAAKK